MNGGRMKLLIATSNHGKVVEIRHELAAARERQPQLASVEVLGLKDLPERLPEPVEDQATFEGNAQLKARHYAELSGLLTLADDSGLEVTALGGVPGVHSARYAGTPCDDAANNRKLLKAMAGVPEMQRGARFVCAMTLAGPDVEFVTLRDTMEGRILEAARGEHGFGYDPLFMLPALGKTSGELTMDEKNQVSHRGKATRQIIAWMTAHFDKLAAHESAR
jgi:XTP/dITP diphosphohydrolase